MTESKHGVFHWNELLTNDVDKAKAFYTTTIGWTFTEMPMPEGIYYVAMLDDKPVGGLVDIKSFELEGVGLQWMSYLQVDDIDALVKTVPAAGGKVLRAPFDVPMVGKIAIVSDPTGAVIGWITPSCEDKSC